MAGKVFNFKHGRPMAGKQIAGLPSTLAGQCFSGVVTGGCFIGRSHSKEFIIFPAVRYI